MGGNAHPELSSAVAEELGSSLLKAVVEQFPDEETKVQILAEVREHDVFLLQPTGAPTNHNAMEAFVMIDALRRASAGRITAVTPYFGYARQDRKEASRVPISAKLMINLFEAAGVDRLLAIDLHAHQIQGFTDKPFDHLYAAKTITKTLKDEIDNPVIVAPDVGASKLAQGYAERLDAGFAIVNKHRLDSENTKVEAIIGESVSNRNVIIVDDMVTTGSTFLKAAEALKEHGAIKVIAAVTHGVLCGDAVSKIERSTYLDMLYTTDTLPVVSQSTKIKRITIAPLLAKAINNIHQGRSVSGLI